MIDALTDKQWQQYEDDGYLRLGRIEPDALQALQDRIDQIMLGKAQTRYERLMMQLDSASGKYDEAGEQSRGFKGATLGYRKIQDLEFDPTFLRYMQRPLFADICRRVYGQDAQIACFRAMFMNKPAHKGTFLPWHQDRWSNLDRDPLLTVYTALDPATVENGCVQIIPGSHKLGLVNPEHPSGFLTPEQTKQHCPPDKVEYLTLEAGEVAILHNWLLHGSDVNRSDIPRRAFSVCYMDARTRDAKRDERYSMIFGQGALDPDTVETAGAA